jgi:hypothetical protein
LRIANRAIGLLVYNLIRMFLTWRIAPLKEEEAASRQTPLYFPRAPGFFSTLFSTALPPGSVAPAGRGIRAIMVRLGLRLRAAAREAVRELPPYSTEIWHAYAPLSVLHRIISFAFVATIVLSFVHFLIFFQTKSPYSIGPHSFCTRVCKEAG